MGKVIFYEGNDATQDVVHETTGLPGQDFFPNVNDEARSLKLVDVRAGAVISVFDDPMAAKTDDFCVITVKQNVDEYVVGTFEKSYEDDTVLVMYAPKNGLDGKVSRIRIN
ncbi:MAG: hypothetical protein ACK2T6_00140 [Anaerolineae bacterium]